MRTDRNYSLQGLQKEIRKYLKAKEKTHAWAAQRLGVTRPYFTRALNDETADEAKHFLLLERFVEEGMGYRLRRKVTFRAEPVEPK